MSVLNLNNANKLYWGNIEAQKLYKGSDLLYPTPLPVDPFIDNVVLHLKGDGANGSTNIIDSSPTPKAVSVFGNAQISTAQSKYGGSSLFSSTTGYLTVSDVSFNLANTSFTIEMWIYPTVIRGDFCGTRSGSNTGGWLLRGGFWYFVNNGWNASGKGINNNLITNEWQHIACCYDGEDGEVRIYRNGELQLNSRFFNYINTQSVISLFAAVNGANQTDNMYIDSFRITKGIDRYIAPFNPETDTYLAY